MPTSSEPAPDRIGQPPTRELFALLSERWNYGILREVFFGTTRFGALQRTLEIAPNTLTTRLNELIDRGLLERHRYREDKDWFDYRLTAAARDIVPAWFVLSQWAQDHLRPHDGTRRWLRHQTCGAITQPVLTCGHCGQPLHGRNLEPADTADDGGAQAESGRPR